MTKKELTEFNDDINAIEKRMFDHELKDFQKATVDHVMELFTHGQNKVLIADEVGLGKTLVAKGVILKMAKLRFNKEKDDLFRVVYICSNLSIAKQNIRRLNIYGDGNKEFVTIENGSDTRLSMQHLKIAEWDRTIQQNKKAGQTHIIPLTPDTSFEMSGKGGNVDERVLMWIVLRKKYMKKRKELKILLRKGVSETTWERKCEHYRKRIQKCSDNYLKFIRSEISKDNKEYRKVHRKDGIEAPLDLLTQYLNNTKGTVIRANEVITKLRMMFARVSADMLEPDLVIMDEFQRFESLLESKDSDTEMGVLMRKFLGSDREKVRDKARVLLLSATPYKLYATREDIDAAGGVDEPYKEFIHVIDFLGDKEADSVKDAWGEYSRTIRNLKKADKSGLSIEEKAKAEDLLYGYMCRTERISVMESEDYIDDADAKNKKVIAINQYDIASYLAASELLNYGDIGCSVLSEYIKSCPYIFSFMRDYKVKADIREFYENNYNDVKANEESWLNRLLWIDDKAVKNYDELERTNARLEKLKEIAFENNSELLLWVPPSRPYYKLQGAFADSEGFSKTLVFSSWEMVPRMIGAMVSYEAERLTVGRVQKGTADLKKSVKGYSADNRYPSKRLDSDSVGARCLWYPSETLSKLYDPIESINKRESLEKIENRARKSIEAKLKGLGISVADRYKKRKGDKPFYIIPILLDYVNDPDSVISWLDYFESSSIEESKEMRSYARELKRYFHNESDEDPETIVDSVIRDVIGDTVSTEMMRVFVDMAIASPAVCFYRSFGKNKEYAYELGRRIVGYFNSPEASAAIQLAEKGADDGRHWMSVLKYCKNGCFQAMVDEYKHILSDSVGGSYVDRNKQIYECMKNDLRLQTAIYDVDTYNAFDARVNNKSEEAASKKALRMRAHYAVAFVNSGTDDEKTATRKDSIRGAFNSPLRPFILATTSIGQEGLDFHNYCRRIMHWNLPSNPVDLEQREGRINRYKCLAIRQNVALEYGKREFKKDIWNEMFTAAAKGERKRGQPELIPYWCFGKNQRVKIERIVPMYPQSRDIERYDRLIKFLSLYRLSMGQPRQQELLEYLMAEGDDTEWLKEYFINISPFSKK